MKQTITETMFKDAFTKAGRGDNFSYNGLSALFEWLEELEEDTGQEMKLDVIGLCCEFSEYETAVDCINDRGYDCDLSDCEEKNHFAMEYLHENTLVIEFDGGIIIQDF